MQRKTRTCLRCNQPFDSRDAGHRICTNCKRGKTNNSLRQVGKGYYRHGKGANEAGNL